MSGWCTCNTARFECDLCPAHGTEVLENLEVLDNARVAAWVAHDSVMVQRDRALARLARVESVRQIMAMCGAIHWCSQLAIALKDNEP